MQDKDFQNYDYLDIIVKKENEQELVDAYSIFLWEKTGEKEDNQYRDVVHLSFRRPHKIENKDRLQLLQVYYESALNERAELKIKKHSKTTESICNLAFFSLVFLFGAGVFIYFLKTTLSIILGSVFALAVFVGDVFLSRVIKKGYKKEKLTFNEKSQVFEKNIETILEEVKNLTKNSVCVKDLNGGNDE